MECPKTLGAPMPNHHLRVAHMKGKDVRSQCITMIVGHREIQSPNVGVMTEATETIIEIPETRAT